MIRKEMIAMLLAGGRNSRLGILTDGVAKSAIPFGGKYRIIDFPLSNCINSGIDTVGVVTRYRPVRLNAHIGIGVPWDLDKSYGGVSVLPTFDEGSGDAIGSAEAVYRNFEYMLQYHPEYVLIAPGDTLCKMDYEIMLDFLKAMQADAAVCALPTREGEKEDFSADLYGYICAPDEDIPADSRQYRSAGIYIFRWTVLKEALLALKDNPQSDFENDVLPYCMKNGMKLCAYEFTGYYEKLSSPAAYWRANLELLCEDRGIGLNLNEHFWKIYTNGEQNAPVYFSDTAAACDSIIGEKAEIHGRVINSVIGAAVTVEAGAIIQNSVIMQEAYIGSGVLIDRAIVCEGAGIGENTVIGTGEFAPSKLDPKIYNSDLVIIGENAVIPPDVRIGRNTVITGVTVDDDYPEGELASGCAIIPGWKEGDNA